MDECHICLENLTGEIAIISCGHKFHYKCIQTWIRKKNKYTKNCCICENDTEIENIITIKDNSINNNNLVSNNSKNNIKNDGYYQGDKNYEISKYDLFSCCTIL